MHRIIAASQAPKDAAKISIGKRSRADSAETKKPLEKKSKETDSSEVIALQEAKESKIMQESCELDPDKFISYLKSCAHYSGSERTTHFIYALKTRLTNLICSADEEKTIYLEVKKIINFYIKTQKSNLTADVRLFLIPTRNSQSQDHIIETAIKLKRWEITDFLFQIFGPYVNKKTHPQGIHESLFFRLLALTSSSIETMREYLTRYGKTFTIGSSLLDLIIRHPENKDYLEKIQFILSALPSKTNLVFAAKILMAQNKYLHNDKIQAALKIIMQHPFFRENLPYFVDNEIELALKQRLESDLKNYTVSHHSYLPFTHQTLDFIKTNHLGLFPLTPELILEYIKSNLTLLEKRLLYYGAYGQADDYRNLLQLITQFQPDFFITHYKKTNILQHIKLSLASSADPAPYLKILHYLCCTQVCFSSDAFLTSDVIEILSFLPTETDISAFILFFQHILLHSPNVISTAFFLNLSRNNLTTHTQVIRIFNQFLNTCTPAQLIKLGAELLSTEDNADFNTQGYALLLKEFIENRFDFIYSSALVSSTVTLAESKEPLSEPKLSDEIKPFHKLLTLYLIKTENLTLLRKLDSSGLLIQPELLVSLYVDKLIKKTPVIESQSQLNIFKFFLGKISNADQLRDVGWNETRMNVLEILVLHKRIIPRHVKAFMEAKPILNTALRELDPTLKAHEQTTHQAAVHESVGKAAKKLHDHYLLPKLLYLQEVEGVSNSAEKIALLENNIFTEIHNFLLKETSLNITSLSDKWTTLSHSFLFSRKVPPTKEGKTFYITDYTTTLRFLDYLFKEPNYALFTENISKLNLKTILMNVWMATNDETEFKTPADRTYIKKLLIQYISEAVRNGNENEETPLRDSYSCPAGFINKFIGALDKKHSLVDLVLLPFEYAIKVVYEYLDEKFVNLDKSLKMSIVEQTHIYPHQMPKSFFDQYKTEFEHYVRIRFGSSDTLLKEILSLYDNHISFLYPIDKTTFPSVVEFEKETNTSQMMPSLASRGLK